MTFYYRIIDKSIELDTMIQNFQKTIMFLEKYQNFKIKGIIFEIDINKLYMFAKFCSLFTKT